MIDSNSGLSIIHGDGISPATILPDAVLYDSRLSDSAKLYYWRLRASVKDGKTGCVNENMLLAELERCGWLVISEGHAYIRDYARVE